MKIAIFTDTYLPEVNGVSICINLLAEKISNTHKVIVFCPKYDKGNKEGNGKFKIVRIKSVPLPVYNTLRFSLPNFVNIYKTLKKFKPDIIHFHTPGPLGITSLILSKYLKIPIVATYHTMYNELLFYISPTGRLKKLIKEKVPTGSFSSLKNFKKLSSAWKKVWKIKRKKTGRVEKITRRAIVEFHSLCDKVIVPSPSVKQLLDKWGLKDKTVNIFNGVDITERFPEKTNYSLKNNILFVGRLAEEKKIDVILKAFKYAKKQLPYLKLTIAGNGPAADNLKKLTNKLKIEKDVTFLGMLPQEKLPEVYQSADIFVIASTAENQALVVLEAMASGLPVIGVKKHGLIDVVVNSRNGYLTKPGNAKVFAKNIIKLIKDDKTREIMGKNSRKIVKDYDIRQTSRKTIDLYKKLVK